jgi:tetratricopeptide (TPR) repeat protein
MGFRFWRRKKLLPGVTLNLSKSGASLSFGPRGAKFTVGSSGKRGTVGIPGTGLFYTTQFKDGAGGGRGRRGRPAPDQPRIDPADRLTLGFFKRLFTSQDEEDLVDGCRALLRGRIAEALRHFGRCAHIPDAACLAGFLALRQGSFRQAETCLAFAAGHHRRLGRVLRRYGVQMTVSLLVTPEITVHVGPDLRGVLLGLTEACQAQEKWQAAVQCLERLRALEPDDLVIRLSFAELLAEARPENPQLCRRIVKLAEGVENQSPVHAALLLYKARALQALELFTAARDALTAGLRRRKGYPPELLRELRYERAGVYEALGRATQARRDLEKLFAEAPDDRDVAARLGL